MTNVNLASSSISQNNAIVTEQFLVDNRISLRYLHNDKGNPMGAVAIQVSPESNEIRVGWSKACGRDHFNKFMGREIAIRRLLSGEYTLPIEPNQIQSFLVRLPDAMQSKVYRILNRIQEKFGEANSSNNS